MTSEPEEPYRPARHFSARRGWINDPNGLIRIDGVWHAFFQHYQGGTTHGPMHWGHATSLDLVHWQEQAIALYPDGLGTCFSGSAIETPDGEIKLFYTAHQQGADGVDHQTQCLVHVDRDFTTFVRDPRNPVIGNPGLAAFRDPKVFRHEPTGQWIMVVTHGQAIGIYSSVDLGTWQLESTFGETEGFHGTGPWECPDLVPLTAPDGQTLWVLIVGIGSGAYAPGSGTQYFVGRFDGVRFENVDTAGSAFWLDYGRDFYASQSFAGQLQAPLVLGWMSNWAYAKATPTRAFRGSLSLPRQLRLVDTSAGLRVAGHVPSDVAAQFERYELVDGLLTPDSGTYVVRGTVAIAPGEARSISLFGEPAPQMIFERSASGSLSLLVRREPREGMSQFAHRYLVPLTETENLDIELYVDNGSVEMVLENGLVWVTNLYFPSQPSGEVMVRSESGK